MASSSFSEADQLAESTARVQLSRTQQNQSHQLKITYVKQHHFYFEINNMMKKKYLPRLTGLTNFDASYDQLGFYVCLTLHVFEH